MKPMKYLGKAEAFLLKRKGKSKFKKINALVIYFLEKIKKKALKHYKEYIELQLLDEEINSKLIVRAIVNNSLQSHFIDKPSSTMSYTSHEEPVFVIDTVLRAAKLIIKEVGVVAGIQSMSGPVGLVFSLKLVNQSEPEVEVEADKFETCLKPVHASEALGSIHVPMISLEVVGAPVEAATTVIGEYDSTIQSDLALNYNIDANVEISKIIASEAVNVVRRDILNAIADNATSTKLPTDISQTELGIEISRASLHIAKTSKRGMANFLIAPIDVIGKLPDMVYDRNISHSDHNGLYQIGVCNNLLVYACSDLSNKILIGYCGKTAFDRGIIIAPYTFIKQTTLNVVTYRPRNRVALRRGMHVNNMDYYRVLELSDD